MISEDSVSAHAVDIRFHRIVRQIPDVVHPPAVDAAHVVMPIEIAVEAGLGAGDLELPDDAHPGQQLQIAVDCRQAELRQTSPGDFVQLRRRRVRAEISQFFEHHLALSSITVEFLGGHALPF
jgi:hypothetical protein